LLTVLLSLASSHDVEDWSCNAVGKKEEVTEWTDEAIYILNRGYQILKHTGWDPEDTGKNRKRDEPRQRRYPSYIEDKIHAAMGDRVGPKQFAEIEGT